MFSVPRDIAGTDVQNTIGWDLIKQLVDIGDRSAGSEGERRGAETVAATFQNIGLSNVQTTCFEVPGWWRDDAVLTIPTFDRRFDGSHEVIGLPGTPSGLVETEVVDVGSGTPEEVKTTDLNKNLALVCSNTPDNYGRWVHRTEKYGLVADAGAAGFLFYNTIPGSLPVTGGVFNNDSPGPIPAVGLSCEVGERLVRWCAHDRCTAVLNVECKTRTATSHTVEATLGPDTDREILVTAHVDAHDIADGATDNGMGCALVAEVADLLSDVEANLETRIRFVIFGSEEIGLRGSNHWAEMNDLNSVKAILNFDGNGSWTDVTVYTHGSAALADTFSMVSKVHEVPFSVSDAYLPHSDHWPLVRQGVPGAMVRSESKTGRGWGHTHADTLDKLSAADCHRLAPSLAEATGTLAEANQTVKRLDVEQMKEGLEATGYGAGMRAAGDWPWS